MAHPTRVLVTADQALIAESVCSALRDLGLDAAVLVGSDERQAAEPAEGGVGLVVSDLDTAVAVRRVESLVALDTRRWVVSTAARPGPLWGAVMHAGAAAVVPTWTSLRQLAATLQEAEAGLCSPDGLERERMVDAWLHGLPDTEHGPGRLRSLSTREHQVLRLLYSGQTVRHIAPMLEISEGTVRAHVKAMLRKLGVSSQLAAVALYGQLRLVGSPTREASAPEDVLQPLDTPTD